MAEHKLNELEVCELVCVCMSSIGKKRMKGGCHVTLWICDFPEKCVFSVYDFIFLFPTTL